MEKRLANAKEMYEHLCRMLDTRDWHYEKMEEDLMIKAGISGDDFPIEFIMRVRPSNESVSFISFLPFKISEAKRVDMALAVCIANYGMALGCFDFDLSDGTLMFKLATSYKNTILSDDLLEYMIMVAASTIDKFNDKFFMISKDMMTVQQFIEWEKSDE